MDGVVVVVVVGNVVDGLSSKVVVVVFCDVVGTKAGAFADSCRSWKLPLSSNSLRGSWCLGIKSAVLPQLVVHCVLSPSSPLLLLLNTCSTAHP